MHFLCKDSIGKGDPLRAVMSGGRQPLNCILFLLVTPFFGLPHHEIVFQSLDLDLRTWRMPATMIFQQKPQIKISSFAFFL